MTYMLIAIAAQGLRGRLRHAHHLRGVAHRDRQVLGPEPGDLALDGRAVAHQHRGEAELAARGHRPLDHDGRAEIASHGVDRDLHGADLMARLGPAGKNYSPSTEMTSRPL